MLRLLSKVALHKIMFIAAVHSLALADAYTTHRALQAASKNPPAGQYFYAVDGVRYLSPGPLHEMDPLLGRHPSAARLYVQISAQDLLADWLIFRGKRVLPPAAFTSDISVHMYGIVDNIRNMHRYALPAPDRSHPCVSACQTATQQRTFKDRR